MTCERLILNVLPSTVEKAKSLMRQLAINSFDDLFDQMVEDLDWSVNYSGPVRAALLASRAIAKAASVKDGPQGDGPRTGEQPA